MAKIANGPSHSSKKPGRKEVDVGGDGKEGMDRKAEGKAFLLLKGNERDFLAQMTAPATMRDIRHCTAAKSLFNSSKPQHFLKMPLRPSLLAFGGRNERETDWQARARVGLRAVDADITHGRKGGGRLGH